MRMLYNEFAGKSLDRLAALSDGVFAIAMTLLVLDLRVPSVTVHTEQELLQQLGGLATNFLAYFMSFLTLGIFWVGQQTQLNQYSRSDRNLAWINLGFLLTVTLMPFSTALLARYIMFRTALVIYWLNILLMGVMLYVLRRYAERVGLIKEEVTAEMRAASERRVVIAQALYAIGAALCIIDTRISIAVIVLVQLNYVIAPRFRPLYRL